MCWGAVPALICSFLNETTYRNTRQATARIDTVVTVHTVYALDLRVMHLRVYHVVCADCVDACACLHIPVRRACGTIRSNTTISVLHAVAVNSS